VDVLELVKIVVPTAATLVGLYFANAFRLRTRQQILERRVDAYVAFWPATRTAASTRLRGDWAGGPLTQDERRSIFDASTDWYYGTPDNPKGYGVFLSDRARRVYLAAKENLICPLEDIRPAAVREHVQKERDVDRTRGEMSIRQLSLLRWVMRFDLEVHTEPYFAELDADAIEFLRACDIDIERGPYRKWIKRDERTSTRIRARPSSASGSA
jgi:hypothetical protein